MPVTVNPDSLVGDVFRAVTQRLTSTGLERHKLRERQHLDPITKDEFERQAGTRPVSQTLRTPDFPRLGPVDAILPEPKALIELKWSYLVPDKIFEGVWDAIKLALLGPRHGYDALYVATGASLTAWAASEAANLFVSGLIAPAEMWRRPLLPPRGPNWGVTIGEDLVIGARGNQPRRAPATILVRHIGRMPVAADYEVRVARVAAMGPLVDWPRTEIDLTGASTTPTATSEGRSLELPARVTQRWIEATAPALPAGAISPFLQALRARGWNENDLKERVMPYLPDR